MYFHAYDEILIVDDDYSDGHRARAEVKVYNSSGSVADRDTFLVSNFDTFELGTPDESGDIAEGRVVKIRVCINGTSYCTDWSTGKA